MEKGYIILVIVAFIIFLAAIIAILVLGLISAIFYKQIIGWFGEHWTKKALSKLPKAKYKIINNLLLSVNGLTHQIDHVVISPYGIFSIETKQYNGLLSCC